MLYQTLRNRFLETDQEPGTKQNSNWKLPNEEFMYGKKNIPDREGAGIVTRSWNIHMRSRIPETQQDFIKVNKIALRQSCTSHKTNSDFRKSVSIKKFIPLGNLTKTIVLPHKDFTYGLPNRPSTPIKSIMNYAYANEAALAMKRSYSNIIQLSSRKEKLLPKSTKHYDKRLDFMKTMRNPSGNQKEMYKIRKYLNVNSKVKQNLNNFKTYTPKDKGNLDFLINKVENEIRELDNQGY